MESRDPVTEQSPAAQSKDQSGKNASGTFPLWAWIAAVALALITGYSIRQMGIQTAQVADLSRQMKLAQLQNQALQVQLELGRQVNAIMLSPDSKLLRLEAANSKLPAVRTYAHPHMGLAVTGDQMPALPAGRTLQLWLTPKRGNQVSIAIFRPDSEGLLAMVVPLHTPLDQVGSMSITEEPSGGSPQPTSAPIWTVELH